MSYDPGYQGGLFDYGNPPATLNQPEVYTVPEETVRRLYVERKKSAPGMDDQSQAWEAQDEDEPAMVWSASIYDRGDFRHLQARKPRVIYRDDRPLELQSREQVPETSDLDDPDTWSYGSGIYRQETQLETELPTWKGCVFEVTVRAESSFAEEIVRASTKPRRAESSSVEETRDTSTKAYSAGVSLQEKIRLEEARDQRIRDVSDDAEFIEPARASEKVTRTDDPVKITHGDLPAQPYLLGLTDVSRSVLTILSPFLCSKLEEIIGYYPSLYAKEDPYFSRSPFHNDPFAQLYEPYRVLLHHFSQISAAINCGETHMKEGVDAGRVGPNKEWEDEIHRLQVGHLTCLYDFLHPLYDELVTPSRILLEGEQPKISFDMLWYLFKPGIDVYTHTRFGLQAAVVLDFRFDDDRRVRGSRRSRGRYSDGMASALEMWYLTTDGRTVGRQEMTHRFGFYEGLREVRSLEVCPASIRTLSTGAKLDAKLSAVASFSWKHYSREAF